MNIVFHHTVGQDLTARLAAISGLMIHICPKDDNAARHHLLRDYDVLWHVLKCWTAEMIATGTAVEADPEAWRWS